MTDKVKNILTGLIIVVILFIAYKFLVAKKPEPEPLPTSKTDVAIGVNPQVSFEAREAAATLQRIKSIKIDAELFSGDVFRSLEDNRVVVLKVPVGRDNPFAPVK
jgi:hypothetical protein